MANTVIALKKSSTPSSAPAALANGELAINFADGVLYYKHSNGSIASISGSGGGNYFGTVNAAGTLLIADTTGDVLGIYSGTNIDISSDAINDTLTISANLKSAYDTANAAFYHANAAFNKANTGGGGGASVNVGSSTPDSPSQGDLWWNSDLGRLFIYYTDTDSSQWTEVTPSGSISTGGTGGTSTDITYVSAQANIAFDKANSANLLAYNTGIGANAWTNSVSVSVNSYAVSIGIAGNNYTIQVGAAANTWANSVGIAGNNYTNSVGEAANNHANATYVKLTSGSQTITGDLSITGNVYLLGNATTLSSNNLIINDSLIYLAANNDSSDILDIGFVGHYSNGTANLHTGLFRDHASKEYYLFNNLGPPEPETTNDLIPYANGMVDAALHASFITSNLSLGGANAITWINSLYPYSNGTANSANAYAITVGAAGNTAAYIFANSTANSANAYAVTVGAAGNTTHWIYANGTANAANAYAVTVGASANNWANTKVANTTDTIFLGTANNTSFVGGANASEVLTASIVYVIDGGGSAITSGEKGYLEIPFSCTINQCTILLDQTGSINVAIQKDTYANFPPTNADSINTSGFVVSAGTSKNQIPAVSITNTTINAGDILGYNVITAATTTRATVSLKVTKT